MAREHVVNAEVALQQALDPITDLMFECMCMYVCVSVSVCVCVCVSVRIMPIADLTFVCGWVGGCMCACVHVCVCARAYHMYPLDHIYQGQALALTRQT